MLGSASKPLSSSGSLAGLSLPAEGRAVSGTFLGAAMLCALFSAALCSAQVFTVGPPQLPGAATLTVVRPTQVALQKSPMTRQTGEQMIRTFQSEQAFAVRPLPLGRHGLALHANGALSPSGSAYVEELQKNGISVKPGDRVIITKFEIQHDRIIFEFNGGPDKRHRILQHIQIGYVPLAQDDGEIPIGSRFTLLFNGFVPEMNAAQLRALIAPILDFSLKTPDQAFADTLPPKLKTAVLDHQVLVGMNREMVLHAIGRPDMKDHEMDGQSPIDIWIYGTPPHEVQFVRFNGNRVIRLEIADIGHPLIIRDHDETGGYFAGQFVHEVRLGDAPVTGPGQEQAPAAPPTLRKPGEQLPDAVDQAHQLKRVQFPKDDGRDSSEPAPIPAPPGQDTGPADASAVTPPQNPGARGGHPPVPPLIVPPPAPPQ